MPNNTPIMLFVLIGLLLLPIRLSSLQLKGLAFFLWFLGGVFLTFRGANFLLNHPEHPGMGLLAAVIVGALVIGWAKGQFVLSKTSRKNIDRLNALTEPQRPIYVYGLRSWIVIGIMALIGFSMNFLPPTGTALLVRGGVNLGIGMALLISSLIYLRALTPINPNSLPDA